MAQKLISDSDSVNPVEAPPAAPTAPRWVVLAGDWCNIIAGLNLVVSFSLIALTFSAEVLDATAEWNAKMIQYTMCAEGVFYALAGAFLAHKAEIEGDGRGAITQTILVFGGTFFAVGGAFNGLPSKIISLRFIFPMDVHHEDFPLGDVTVADACFYYGILCFMIATSRGIVSVRALPKDRLVSPFWGVFFFFAGAWIIGAISLWGPAALSGFAEWPENAGDVFAFPTFKATWVHYFQVIGAACLTMGALIFGCLDNIFGGGGDGSLEESESESDPEADS
eukprot:TRINITY_DN9082_c0_g1_i1.p1 TRINITY_DN9082_c0_g1~~TRINITY_DN9082_c0_g1_i1.p1  ORF type:complete len:305 (-),score=78.83 TRINITY_DN9082_c0_g1_i1:142-981(-)